MAYKVGYYDIVLRRHVPALPKTMRELIHKAIETRIQIDPISYGKPLSGSLKGHRRLRVGDYRIIYRILPDGHTIHIVAIGHRKEIYEGF